MGLRASRIVFAAGVAYTLWLQAVIGGETFITGDAGQKGLLARQYSSGRLRLDLDLPAPPWAKQLWKGGLYPIAPPYVTRVGDRYYSVYPAAFPAITAPFYRLLGYRGLYVIPLLSAWLLWWSLLRGCRALHVGERAASVSLAVLVFASPITFYTATYWEHTLAVLLGFHGVMLLWAPVRAHTTRSTLAGGALVGAAVWFRGEMMVLVGLAGAITIASFAVPRLLPQGGRAFRLAFLAGLLLPAAAFFTFNALAYGGVLGFYPASLLQGPIGPRWLRGWRALVALSRSLLVYFPTLAFVALGLPLLWRLRRRRAALTALLLLFIGACFCLAVPLLVREEGGRQWGPRFLFVAIPMACIALAVLVRALELVHSRALRAAALLCLGLLTLRGAWLNTVEGLRYLQRNQTRRLEPLRLLEHHTARYVAVSHLSVAQQLSAAMGPKTFFLTERAKDLRALARELAAQGENRFLYLCYPAHGCGPLGEQTPRLTLFVAGSGRPLAEFSSLGAFDRYLAYEVTVARGTE